MSEANCPYHRASVESSEKKAVMMPKKERLSNEFLGHLDEDSRALCIFMEEFGVASSSDIKSLVEKLQRQCDIKNQERKCSNNLSLYIRLLRYEIGVHTLLSVTHFGRLLTFGLMRQIHIVDQASNLKLLDEYSPCFVPNPDWSVEQVKLFYQNLARLVKFCSKYAYAEAFAYTKNENYQKTIDNAALSKNISDGIDQSGIINKIKRLYQDVFDIDNGTFGFGESFEINIKKLLEKEIIAGIKLLANTTWTVNAESPTGLKTEINGFGIIEIQRGENRLYMITKGLVFGQNQFVDIDGRIFRKHSACPFAKKLQPISSPFI